MAREALADAIEKLGGQKRLAEKIGTTQSVVWYWLERAKKPVPPAEFVMAIEEATNGKVTRHDLRPDLFPRSAA